jgi:hypothetical protein
MNLPIPNRFTPERYEIVDTEQARFLKRELRKPDIFMYRHRVHKNFVICCWLKGEPGWFVELAILSKPQAMTKEIVRTLREWASDSATTLRDVRKNLWAEQREARRQEEAQEQEARSAKKFLARQRTQNEPHFADIPTFPTNLRTG